MFCRLLVILLCACIGTPALATTERVRETHREASAPHVPASHSISSKTKNSTSGVTRTKSARIKRSTAAKHQFEKETGFPKGRPGYVVDHVVPLACGGADAPGNMQWQTIAEGKAKDKVERIGCAR